MGTEDQMFRVFVPAREFVYTLPNANTGDVFFFYDIKNLSRKQTQD